MASTEEHAIVPIFRLPDEVLMKIFSYITFIPEKINLEQVSRRIHSVSAKSQSWKGIHKLEMFTTCDDLKGCDPFNSIPEELRGSQKPNISLNGVHVYFAKWPAAIKLFLDRTNINQLIIRIGKDIIDVFEENPTVIPELIELFQQIQSKMKVKSVELHFCTHPTDTDKALSFEGDLKTILIKPLQISIPYLEEVVLGLCFYSSSYEDVHYRAVCAEIWPVLKQCNSLKSVELTAGLDIVPPDLKFLMEKPLKKVELSVFKHGSYSQNLVKAINSSTGKGVETLVLREIIDKIPDFVNFNHFCDGLTANSREKFKVLTIGIVLELEYVHLIPSIFPNLEIMDIGLMDWPINRDEFCTVTTKLLIHAHSVSSTCKMTVRTLLRFITFPKFKRELRKACGEAEIDVKFDEYPERKFVLSKGNTIITIFSRVC